MSFPPDPLLVDGPGGPWTPLLRELDNSGVGLVVASEESWRRYIPDTHELPGLLGDDWVRYQAMGTSKQRDRLVVTRMLLKHVAAVAVCADPLDLELSYGMAGRLSVRGLDQVDISLTHTDDFLLVGITSLGLIGVDIELATRQMHGLGMEYRMCTSRERTELAQLGIAEQNALLVQLWTLKEAYSKAIGQGLHFPFSEFGFQVTGREARMERADGTPVTDPTWRFGVCPAPGGYLAAVALQDTRKVAVSDTRAHTALNRQILQAIYGKPEDSRR